MDALAIRYMVKYLLVQVRRSEGCQGKWESEVSQAKKGNKMREQVRQGREHLTINNKFQSDKYNWCHAGFVPLKQNDPDAMDLLAIYAMRRGRIDPQFKRDLLEALSNQKPSGDRS